jgi:hypothetical protein
MAGGIARWRGAWRQRVLCPADEGLRCVGNPARVIARRAAEVFVAGPGWAVAIGQSMAMIPRDSVDL